MTNMPQDNEQMMNQVTDAADTSEYVMSAT